MQFLGVEEGMEILTWCDTPSQLGLGSSSAFIVCLLKALHTLDKVSITPKNLAKQAIKIERELLNEPGGYNDQVICATNTGLSITEFKTDGDFEVKPLSVSRDFADYFSSCLTLVYISSGRESFKVAESLDSPTTEDTKHEYKRITLLAKEEFEKGNIFDRGGIADLLEETWMLKRDIAPLVTNDRVEDCYIKCKKAGAQAFKLLGSGNGGMAIALVRPENMRYFKERIGYKTVDFKFDYEGAKVIYRSEQ